LSGTPSTPFFEIFLDNFRAKLGGFGKIRQALHTIKALTLLFLSMSLRSQGRSGKKLYHFLSTLIFFGNVKGENPDNMGIF
jgi:hypothetical protein